jgi:cell division cycle protein 37
MEKANQRIKMLERDLKKIDKRKEEDDDDDDDDDIDDTEGIKIELEELRAQIKLREDKLDEYEKNKKWNVDNMFQVKEERTMINPNSPTKESFTPSGYAAPTITGEEAKKKIEQAQNKKETDKALAAPKKEKPVAALTAKPAPVPVLGPAPPTKHTTAATSVPPSREEESDPNFVYSYHEFTERYADLMEDFMMIKGFEGSKEFLTKNGQILLQENASNYLLLASLEDEMNGFRDKMRQTAKQSQIISNIAELAKSWNTHPGNVIIPFFTRMQQREFLDGFLQGVEAFVQKIISRAVVKKKEIDLEREHKSGVNAEGVDLNDIPKEERLGPGGLDPLEVVETLPVELQEAFESRDVEQLKKVLLSMDPKDAEYHMKRCVDSGLWQAQA